MPVRSVRRRYLWIHVLTDQTLDYASLNEIIHKKIHYLYGVKGAVELNYKLIDFFPKKKNAIIRCNHDRLIEMRTVLAQITVINGKPSRIGVKRVSGTIKTLKRHFINLVDF
ncbi:hypothetical protein GF326_01200 [Candidatus Bathyarchaeota archaeon]|nr:hypothetical protein [Candidatus Bathyarchaeota archaeon]